MPHHPPKNMNQANKINRLKIGLIQKKKKPDSCVVIFLKLKKKNKKKTELLLNMENEN